MVNLILAVLFAAFMAGIAWLYATIGIDFALGTAFGISLYEIAHYLKYKKWMF